MGLLKTLFVGALALFVFLVGAGARSAPADDPGARVVAAEQPGNAP